MGAIFVILPRKKAGSPPNTADSPTIFASGLYADSLSNSSCTFLTVYMASLLSVSIPLSNISTIIVHQQRWFSQQGFQHPIPSYHRLKSSSLCTPCFIIPYGAKHLFLSFSTPQFHGLYTSVLRSLLTLPAKLRMPVFRYSIRQKLMSLMLNINTKPTPEAVHFLKYYQSLLLRTYFPPLSILCPTLLTFSFILAICVLFAGNILF